MAADLYSLKTGLTEAVINAFMRRSIVEIIDGSCAEGKFEYVSPGATAAQAPIDCFVTYPGGEWKRDGGLLGDDHGADFQPFDARQIYADIDSAIDEIFQPFLEMPKPADFDADIALLQEVANALRAGGTVDLDGSGSDTKIETGNAELDAYVTGIESELVDLNGVAMKALRDYYATRIRTTLSGQHALTVVTGVLISGEKKAWERVAEDLANLFTNATAQFNALATANEASWDAPITVLKAVADAAGVFGLPLGVLGTAIGKADTVRGLVSPYLPEAPSAGTLIVQGATFDDVWNTFTTSLQAIDQDLTATEDAFLTCAQNAADTYAAQAHSFELAKPRRFIMANDRNNEVFKTSTGQLDDEVVVNDALKYIAGRFELIGDHQRTLAHRLGGAFQHALSSAAPRAVQSGPVWERGALWGVTLGLGPTGHYPAYEGMLNLLIDLLLREGDEAHRVAEKCLDVLSDFLATDATIERGLDRLAERVEGEVLSSIGRVG